MLTFLVLIGSYLLGSIPFGLMIVKAWKGIDIREHGSKNIGATNVMRTAGSGPAVAVFIADVLKGFIPVMAAKMIYTGAETAWIIVASGILAMMGHTLSVFLKFKGGKGVATGLGVVIGLNPAIAGLGFLAWTITLAITRYVSVASLIGVFSIAILMFVFDMPVAFKAFGILAAVYVTIKHRSNISRLMQGKELKWGQKVDTGG